MTLLLDGSYCMLFALGLAFILSNPTANAFIPLACIGNVSATGGSGVCCPAPSGSNRPCGGRGIGSCENRYIEIEPLPSVLLSDDRMYWPTQFFERTCRCEGNYFGIACDECWFGWEGPLCNQRSRLVRRNIMSYTPEERRRFVAIVSQMPHVEVPFAMIFEKENKYNDPLNQPQYFRGSLQYWIAFVHEYASRGTMFGNKDMCERLPKLNNNHNVVGFNTWHRYLMLIWERELRKIASAMFGWDDFAIPYWDWVDAKRCDVCTNDLVGAPGRLVGKKQYLHKGSPFSNWTEYCTMPQPHDNCIGCHAKWPFFDKLNRHFTSFAFPTTADLAYTLDRKNYYLPDGKEDREKCRGFHHALEGGCGRPGNGLPSNMHNQVHNVVDGSFCCSPTASNDPLFILHHSQIDRIFQVWFEHYRPTPTEYPNQGVEPGSCRECNIIGFIPAVRHSQMFVDMRDLGIYYDNYDFGRKGYSGREFIEFGPASSMV